MQARRLLFPKVGHVRWENFDIPAQPPAHNIVIESICSLISVGTELAIFSGSHIGFTLPNPPFPMMPNNPGYALVGRVTAIGDDVEQFIPGLVIGDRVLAEAPHGTAALVDVRTTSVTRLPDDVGDEQATLIRLAGIALTAARVAPVQIGDCALVFGLGLVGQLAAQLLALNGARPAIGVDQIADRIAVAQSNGSTVVNTREVDLIAEVSRLTGGLGPDLVVEATGSPAVAALCLELVGTSGRVVLLGSTRGKLELDVYSLIHRKGVQVIGAHETVQDSDLTPHVRWTKSRNLQLLADLFATGKLSDRGLISHRITPGQTLGIYPELAANPQNYLGVIIDWQ